MDQVDYTTLNDQPEYEVIEYKDLNDDDLTVVNEYGEHTIEDLYYDSNNNRFLFDTDVNYRVLHVNFKRSGSAYVNCESVEGKPVQIMFTVFKRLYGFQMM